MRKIFLLTGLILSFNVLLNAQTREITGRVTDSAGNSLPGASVNVKGLKKGTSAAADGIFRIAVPQGATLLVSAIGFSTEEISVTNADNINIQLHSSGSRLLNEVVVTSLGARREKRALTYSTQEIKGDVLVAAKQDNVVNALAGKISGVQVTNSTGMPGSSSRIVIRGATSLNGENQPLFIVDGVPIDNTEAGGIDAFGAGPDNVSLSQGSTSNRGIDIDPNIIESINVLKGAAATAIYGSAGARGAIVITTKSGTKSAKPQISLSSSFGISDPIYYPYQDKYAQGQDNNYYDPEQGQFISASWGPLIDTLLVNGAHLQKHNPQKEFFNTGHTFDNNISISGANDKSRYLFSYSYLQTDGVMPKTDFIRHSFFGKFSNQISNKITSIVQFNYINSVNNRIEEGNSLASPLWTIYAAPISWNPKPTTNPDGSQRLYRIGRNNPYFVVDNTGFVSTVNRILPVVTLAYTPLRWMTITERLGLDIYSDQSAYHESNLITGGFFNNNGGVSNRTQHFQQLNNDVFAEIHKDLSEDLNISVLAGMNIFSQTSNTYIQTGQGMNVADFYNISNMTTVTGSSYLSRYRKVGYYAQANLEYRKMLEFSLTGRYDGSSVLAINKSYYPYGSAAAGFIFSELMKGGNSPISFGKIRVSYASVGNDNLAPYSLTTPYVQAIGSANNISYPFNGQNAFVLANILGNSTLRNENLNEFETGLELKLFNNRISFEGSYFDRKTTNLLTVTPIAYSSGFFKYNLNAGSMQDKGIELLLTGVAVKSKNFNWEITANFTKIKNKVLSLGGVDKIQFGGFGTIGTYAFPNLPYGVIYGTTYERNEKGQILITDGTGLPVVGPNGIIGNLNPDFTAGLTNTFTYKGFSLSFLFDWKQGGDILNFDNYYNNYYGTTKVTEDRRPRIVNGVNQGDGKANTVAVSAQDYFRFVSNGINESLIEKSTYIKLRNVSLSYNIRPAALKSSPFKSVAITLTGNNLWIYKPYFTGSDPEASLQGSGNGQGLVNFLTPTSRSYILGVKLGF